MLRKFLLIVLPFAVPFVLYGLYYLGVLRRRKAGLSEVPWAILFGSGRTLSFCTLFVYAMLSTSEPGLDYQPARLLNGEVIPAETN